jgi:pyrroline-5-carboxylate reductase
MFEGAAPLLLVGAGKMGGAMLGRWLELGLDARLVTVLDPYLDKDGKKELLKKHARVAVDAAEAGGPAYRIVLLAVKPQSIDDALPAIAPLANAGTAIVSIAAGVRLERFERAFAARQSVVRAMPNTPAQIGAGVTVAVANAHVSPAQRATVDALLAAVGKTAWVDDENLIDAVTAVSGSGPAYVFLLAECLAEAARKAGLPSELADLLARETVAGAGALLAASPLDPAVLRKNVTSPGGTTQAALSVLMAEDGLQPLLTRAVEAAKKRSVELG